MFRYLIFTISFLVCSFRLQAQLGDPFILTFPPSAYQSDAYMSSPQNWGIVQDNRGMLYVSNTTGVLEFDGTKWQFVEGTAYTGRFQLAKGSSGVIYVGSTNDMGYLSPDSVGRMQFVSLLPHLKSSYPVTRVIRVVAVGSAIYFSTENRIFRWSGTDFKVWYSEAGFSRIFENRNKLYAIDKAEGLVVLQQEQFVKLPGTEQLKDFNVVALLPLPETAASKQSFFVVTHQEGLYTYRDSTLKKLQATPAALVQEASYMYGIQLPDSTYALATSNQGIIVLDHAGQVVKAINKRTGLSDNKVISLYTDREGGLWAALNKGISRIDYPSPVSFLNENSGLDGVVLSIFKKKNLLYVGTTSGLYIADEQDPVATFHSLPQLKTEVWKIIDAGDALLIAGSTGIYALTGSTLEKVSPPAKVTTYKTVLQSKREPAKFYVGSSAGLAMLSHRRGKWKWEGKVKGVDHDVIGLAADKEGRIWASCDNNISMISDSEGFGLQPPTRNFMPPPKQAEKLSSLQVYEVGGDIYFGTSKGLYSFQQHGERFQLKPDASFGTEFADGSREAINLTQDRKGRIWLTSEFRTGVLHKSQGKAYVWDTIPLSKVPKVDVWTIHADATGVLWLATTEGIFRYDPDVPKDYRTPQQTILRKIKLMGDSTVFYGSFAGKGTATVTQPPKFRFVLPHAVKAISFEYSASSYDAPGQLLYSTMLEGEDKNWSRWTTETKKEFTGLDEGKYVFKVKSKTIYGTENLASTFEFVSLPPFYRTWWAYAFYVLLYGLVIWGFIKLKHRNLIASKKSLEKLVRERTAQLETEKKKSDDLLLNILPAETAEELKANGRALARSYEAATVLFTDFKDFTQISEHLTPEELVAIIDFYFCAFDRIISSYNIEKIKTIGDAYMCAGGIPNPEANTPADVVKAALEILQFVKSLNPDTKQLKRHKFEIRVGIHTGPVVAGIVGTTKFAYDIWGDTVNTAARMESCGEVGRVNISGATYQIIKDEFRCTYRGKVDAKNKGDIDMYFVEAQVDNPVLA